MNALQFITNTNRYNARNRAPQSWLTLLAVAALSLSGAAAANPAKGTLTACRQSRGHSKRKARLSRQRPHAFGDKAVRLLILSEVDPGVYIKSCATMTCATEKRESGPGSNKAWVITALRRLLEANGRLIDDEASAEQAARMRHNNDIRQERAKASTGMRRSGSTRKMVIE